MVPWSTSNRRSELPPDWNTRRAKVKRWAGGKCEKCGQPGNQCDHIIPGSNHALSNLQWLCEDCHRTKTLQEAKAAQPRRGARPPEKHPGLKW